jgi:hypothetical protein
MEVSSRHLHFFYFLSMHLIKMHVIFIKTHMAISIAIINTIFSPKGVKHIRKFFMAILFFIYITQNQIFVKQNDPQHPTLK